MHHNGRMLSGKARRRAQRITVGVIVGAVVISLALSLLSAAVADQGRAADVTAAAASSAARVGAAGVHAADTPQPSPAMTDSPLVGSSTDPRPVTKTPQGQATQVTDKEHIGGLIGFIAFMLGGLLLLLRGRARDRREREAASILS